MFFGKPTWYKALPPHLKPPENLIAKIEHYKRGYHLSDDDLFGGIMSSSWAVIRTQEATLQNLKATHPQANERDLWAAVLLSRLEIKMNAPAPWDPSREELMEKARSIDSIMSGIESWEQLMDYIVTMDAELYINNPVLAGLNLILSLPEKT